MLIVCLLLGHHKRTMSTLSEQKQQQQQQYEFVVQCQDLTKPAGPISTGVGFLDHMIDQFNSHAQIGVSIQQKQDPNNKNNITIADRENDKNRNATITTTIFTANQAVLMQTVGAQLGASLRSLLVQRPQAAAAGVGKTSRFCCPLDEALVACELRNINSTENDNDNKGKLSVFTLPPYGKFPRGGRQWIGRMQTTHLEVFWSSLAEHAGLEIQFDKIRGDNAHHIVEATFKAFSRALRNLLDGVNTVENSTDRTHNDGDNRLEQMYGPSSENCKASIALHRQATVERSTKETSIHAKVQLNGTPCRQDNENNNSENKIDTGITTLDQFLQTLAQHAEMTLDVTCQGDLWIDEHHTAEDVAIAVGQVLNTALGTKAGLTRMWSAIAVVPQEKSNSISGGGEEGKATIEVTMDLSNRPCLTHNLPLEHGLEEKIGDLSLEMMDHVLDSLVVNARMTVHIVYKDESSRKNENGNAAIIVNHSNIIHAVAVAFGKALKYCSMVDCRRAGVTASSKGTLSV